MEMKKRKTPYVKFTLVGLCLFLLALGGAFSRWQNYCYDLYSEIRLRSGVMPAPASPVIVCIDEDSLHEFGRWPWSRRKIAELIAKIASGNPEVVGLDLLFAEEGAPEEDKELGVALSLLNKSVLIERVGLKACYGLWGTRLVVDKPEKVIPVLKKNASRIGFADVLPSFDGVVREIPLQVRIGGEVVNSFVGEILSLTQDGMSTRDPDKDLLLTIGRELESFQTISAGRLLSGKISPENLKSRIVLIGVTASGLESDRFRVSVAKMGEIPGVYLHAYALATILSWKEVLRVHPFLLLIVTLLTSWIAGTPFHQQARRRRWGLYTLLTLSMIVFMLPLALFFCGLYLDPVLPFIAALVVRTIVFIEELCALRAEERRLKSVFSRYLSPEVLNQVLTGPRPELAGKRETITVLIADLRGFTTFAENRAPEEVVKILNTHLTLMTDLIFSYGGTLDKFLGDAVMAFFGAPLGQRDHAKRAIKAGLEILKVFSGDDQYLPVGIGISTGEAMVGNIGGGKRLEYTAIGDTVNIAARLQELAGPGEIWATSGAFSSEEEERLAQEWRVIKLRGRESPVRVGIIKGLA